MIRKFISFISIFVTSVAGAQEVTGPQMADGMRSDGKIYVVITVIGLIFLALSLLLLYIERKVKRLEDELKNK